jgi:LysR family glycine cleavage system transcriptional activator
LTGAFSRHTLSFSQPEEMAKGSENCMKRSIPPLNALKAFEAAARHSSFRDAAQELHVSHSAISHHIKHLEVFLSMDLFIRTARAVELTQNGRSYYPVLRDAFDRISEGTKTLLYPKSENIITLQTYSTFAVRWLIPRLEKFYAQYPNYQIRLLTSQQNPDFERDDIDLALYIGKETRTDLHYEVLLSPFLFPVCSPKLMQGENTLKTPDDLVNHTILQVYPSEDDWHVWLNENNVENVNPDSGLRFDSYDHAIATAIRGLGVALATKPYVAADMEANLLVSPFPDHKVRSQDTWYLVHPKGLEKTPKVEAFRDWIISQVKEDASMAGQRRRAV